jgi:Flp pilus assembly protein TadG
MWNLGVKQKRGERGVMMAVAAIGFTTFLFAAGMAVDVSNFYTAGTELQNAADAAALAGATMLNSTKPGIQQAVERATSVANRFNFNVSTVDIPASNVRFAVNLSQFDNGGLGLTQSQAEANPASIRFLRVQIAPTDVNVYLAGAVLGSGTSTFTRTAVAGQSASGFTAGSTQNDPGLTSISNPSRIVLVEDHVGGGTLSVDGTCASSTVYTKGCAYTVNMTPPCDALSATYEIAEGSYKTGADNWSKRIVGGLNGCYCAEATLPVNTHPQAINVRNGLDTLFNRYNSDIPVSMAAEFPPDANIRQNITYDQYKNGSPSTAPTASSTGVGSGVAGRRILVLPIMKKDSWWIDPNDPNYETASMKAYKYGAFFIKRRPSSSGQIQLEYIGDRVIVPAGNACACPTGPGFVAAGADTTSGLAVPVLYR